MAALNLIEPISRKAATMRSVCFIIVCVLVRGLESAILYEDQVEIAGHEGQCYDKERITFYNEGDVMRVEETDCTQKNCLGYNSGTGKIRIQILTCPTVQAGPGCIVVQNKTLPYPGCCPQIIEDQSFDQRLLYCQSERQKSE
ncbi:hypothetical protein RUM44_002675 [Polyplax serrata]|uniref:Single domain-containing protein n=1 Tax=Polyplax serrata TaxID=468196 RepID=A0ABR1AFE2_POLSC